MMHQNQADATGPCFITDGPPSNDLPIPPHRTMNLPQILASLNDEALARWPGAPKNRDRCGDRERRE